MVGLLRRLRPAEKECDICSSGNSSPPAFGRVGCSRILCGSTTMMLRWRVAAGVVLSLLLLLIFAAAVLLRVRVAARKKKRRCRYTYNESLASESPAYTFSQERRGLSKSVDTKTGGRLLTREDDIELEPADDIIDSMQKDLDAVVLNGSHKDLVAFADQAAESSRQAGVHGVGPDQV